MAMSSQFAVNRPPVASANQPGNSRPAEIFEKLFGIILDLLLLLRDCIIAIINGITALCMMPFNAKQPVANNRPGFGEASVNNTTTFAQPAASPNDAVSSLRRRVGSQPTTEVSGASAPTLNIAALPTPHQSLARKSSLAGSEADSEVSGLSLKPPVSEAPCNQYTSDIKACAVDKNWQRVLQIITDMESQEIPLDGIAYNTAIAVCSGAGRWQEALHLLSRARGHPDVITYNATIKACQEARQWQKALQLIDEMRARGLYPDVGKLVFSRKSQ